jgi:penicillin-binding protein 1A
VKRPFQIAVALGVALVLTLGIGAAMFYALILRDLPEIYSLADYRPRIITRIYAADGSEIGSYAEERRVVIPIEDVPRHVIQAFVAAEDASFYEHRGLDYPGIFRAFIKNLLAGEVRQGASTITQQVAKTFLLSSERSYIRKLKDMVLARRIERHFDKEQILYLYLNQIYLGSGAYGIEAAAQTYFGKPARELTPAEGAVIAGVVPAPSLWNPHRSPEQARAHQLEVLDRMLEKAFLNPEQRKAAAEQPLVFAQATWSEREAASAHFVEEVRRYLVGRYGEARVKTDGLQVYTTLDVGRQLAAYRALRHGLYELDHRQGYRGPIRNVPREQWGEELETLAELNAVELRHEELRHRGLVLAVDDEAGQARVALGPGREVALTLEQLAWARKPDPGVDGMNYRLRRLSDALQPGDLIWLQATAVREPEDPLAGTPPEYEYALFQEPEVEGALLAIDLDSGKVDALVGGYSFARSQFNRALQSRRQPGSAFKPIIYAAGLLHGLTPSSIVYDTPITYVDPQTGFQWKPENYTRVFYGPITLRAALAHSRNVATIKVLRDLGLEQVIETARRLGITSPLDENLGLALGNSAVTLSELVRAYSAFAAGGRLIDPVFIREIRDRSGQVLEQDVTLIAGQLTSAGPDVSQGPPPDAEPEAAQPPPSALEALMEQLREETAAQGNGAEQRVAIPEGYALDPVSAFLMTDLLEAVVQEGTGRAVRALGRPVAGKTGTTNDLFDAWFIGFTPEIAAGVWTGFDSARSLGRHETGGRAAAPIFLEFMQAALKESRPRSFEPPPGVAFVQIDRETGLLPCGRRTLFQPFREGTAPDRSCDEPTVQAASGPRLD